MDPIYFPEVKKIISLITSKYPKLSTSRDFDLLYVSNVGRNYYTMPEKRKLSLEDDLENGYTELNIFTNVARGKRHIHFSTRMDNGEIIFYEVVSDIYNKQGTRVSNETLFVNKLIIEIIKIIEAI